MAARARGMRWTLCARRACVHVCVRACIRVSPNAWFVIFYLFSAQLLQLRLPRCRCMCEEGYLEGRGRRLSHSLERLAEEDGRSTRAYTLTWTYRSAAFARNGKSVLGSCDGDWSRRSRSIRGENNRQHKSQNKHDKERLISGGAIIVSPSLPQHETMLRLGVALFACERARGGVG